MHIEMDNMLAETILEVQNVCNEHGLDLTDLSLGVVWKSLVETALYKINDEPFHLEFNTKGCQSSRFNGTGEPNASEIGLTNPE